MKMKKKIINWNGSNGVFAFGINDVEKGGEFVVASTPTDLLKMRLGRFLHRSPAATITEAITTTATTTAEEEKKRRSNSIQKHKH